MSFFDIFKARDVSKVRPRIYTPPVPSVQVNNPQPFIETLIAGSHDKVVFFLDGNPSPSRVAEMNARVDEFMSGDRQKCIAFGITRIVVIRRPAPLSATAPEEAQGRPDAAEKTLRAERLATA
jgi:hypothetical protein